MANDIPNATYRLQFNSEFTFDDATRLIPYLSRLGISHVYASPYLKARAGSPHGYDIVDHDALNPEIGDDASYQRLVDALRQHGMGQILDIVPNHMGVGGSDNAWWLDVLEHGAASPFDGYFDIDWYPAKQELQHKVLLPFLGDHYGHVLERGELVLTFDDATGALYVKYFEHVFPLDVRTYPAVLEIALQRAPDADAPTTAQAKLEAVIEQCRKVPRRNELSRAQRRQRRELSNATREQLRALLQQESALARAVAAAIEQMNGNPGDARSFDRLHRLLESQAFRLSYWQVASHEINYRRFFDINSLAGIRVEDPEVFARTHSLIGRLVRDRCVHGLRIDHPDGLSNPGQYYRDLQQYFRPDFEPDDAGRSVYLLVEKILASHERLPPDWPVHGTTGYEVAYALNRFLVDPDGDAPLSTIYHQFISSAIDFDELLYDRKRLIIRSTLASELTVLSNLLNGISETNRNTRDFTLQGLREALAELAACFPVYRTYISDAGVTDKDRQYVQWAIAQAKRRSRASDLQIFDFIEHVILEAYAAPATPSRVRQRVLRFVRRLQQYTAPVMAKGMEDTAFYAYHRLISLNDVGFDPRTFGVSVAGFHQDNRVRHADLPHSMVATSTHDSKRSEDVRARINVISEIPDLWWHHVERWQRFNRTKKKLAGTVPAPDANDEYLVYQTLLGCWPVDHVEGAAFAEQRGRVEEYLIKALREAKVHTSWINPDDEYESAMRQFVHALLDEGEHNPFLADFLPFVQRIGRFGYFNALTQTLLKFTIPGVPDIYQGNESWTFSLTDPDNRRPVDFERCAASLDQLHHAMGDLEAGRACADEAQQVLVSVSDGRAKLFVTWRALELRRRYADLFRAGDYQALTVTGPLAEHVCAFARAHGDDLIVVAAPRWYARLLGVDSDALPIGDGTWQDTGVALPPAHAQRSFRNVLTGEHVSPTVRDGEAVITAGTIFEHFAPALLRAE